jgi:hypothetical protein
MEQNFKASQDALNVLKKYLRSDEFALYYLGIIQTEINAHGTDKICQDSL